jgi:hypothetical protein
VNQSTYFVVGSKIKTIAMFVSLAPFTPATFSRTMVTTFVQDRRVVAVGVPGKLPLLCSATAKSMLNDDLSKTIAGQETIILYFCRKQ